MAATPFALTHYRREVIQLIAEISMGAGTLVMIGGTVVIVGFLTLATGGTLAVQGYSSLGNVGIEALTGFSAAFINVRISAPVVAGQYPHHRGDDRHHTAVLHRGDLVVLGQPVHHGGVVGPVRWSL